MSLQTPLIITAGMALLATALWCVVTSPALSDRARLGWIAALVLFNVFGALAFFAWYGIQIWRDDSRLKKTLAKVFFTAAPR